MGIHTTTKYTCDHCGSTESRAWFHVGAYICRADNKPVKENFRHLHRILVCASCVDGSTYADQISRREKLIKWIMGGFGRKK